MIKKLKSILSMILTAALVLCMMPMISLSVSAENIATAEQMVVIRKIIYAVETGGQVYGNVDYDNFTEAYTNSSIEYAITIGGGQWYATEAQRLLKLIRTTDPATFAALDTAGIGTDLDTKDWSTYQVSKTSAKAKCIQAIIGSSVGIKCQDQLIDEQMSAYMAEARSLGVTDIDAQMMCANFRHQGGLGAVKRIIAKTPQPYTLDNLYAACQTDTGNQVGAYKSRQKMVYESLKKYLPEAVSEDAFVKELIFDANFYANSYKDLKDAYGYDADKLYDHFINYGLKEGRIGSPYFSISWYREQNADLLAAFGSDNTKAFEHFLKYVKTETNRKMSPILDCNYYRSRYVDLNSMSEFDLMKHFKDYGTAEGRQGSAEFDPICYCFYNNDVYESLGVAGCYIHYMQNGIYETNPWRRYTNTKSNLGNDFYATITDKNSGKNLQLFYDVADSEYLDKNSVQINTASDSEAQFWRFTMQADGTYKITNMAYGKALDVYNTLRTSANIGTWDDNGSEAQRWKLYFRDGYCIMRAECSDNVADVHYKNTDDRSEVVCSSYNGGDNQLFKINIQYENLGEDFYAKIKTKCDLTKVLSLNDSESIVINTNTGSEDQLWHFVLQSDGSYEITNTQNGKCIDLSGANTEDKTDIITYTDNDSEAQRWYIQRDASNYYIFKPKCGLGANVAMDLYGATTEDGSNISIHSYNGTNAQLFLLEYKSVNLGDSFYATITTSCDSSKALSLDDSESVVIRTNTEAEDQVWEFELQSDGTYKITNTQNGKCLDVNGAQTANQTDIITYTDNGTAAQRWIIVEIDENYYSLRPVCGVDANVAMDLNGAQTEDGSNISIYSYNGTNAQKFVITELDNIGLLKGDVNCDGVINIRDVTELQKLLVHGAKFDENMTYICDTNLDGAVNIRDATQIQKYCVGMIKEFKAST